MRSWRCVTQVKTDPDLGISEGLARERAARLSNLRYDLAFTIPAARTQPVARPRADPLLARPSADRAAGARLPARPRGIPAERRGERRRRPPSARSTATSSSPPRRCAPARTAWRSTSTPATRPLNRNDEFLYTIFVPARAHQAFPCFDQPDLKARWSLALDVPEGWQALGNGAETRARKRRRADARPLRRHAADLDLPLRVRRGQVQRSSRRSGTAARSACSIARPTRRRWRATATRSSICTPAALDWLEDYTGDPVSVRQVRLPAGAGVPVRRHGASGRRSSTTRTACCSTRARRRTRCSAAPA